MTNTLKSKVILFLGSSVTEGSGAGGVSFADMLVEHDGIIGYKEAVCGTTLADVDGASYVARLKNGSLPKDIAADAFVCQLSTNDAGRGLPIEQTKDAIIEICNYVKVHWGCPIFFYTGTYFDSPHYAALVEMLKEIAPENGIKIINLWDDQEMRAVSTEDYAKYMNDGVHPTYEGYEKWWLPKFEKFLLENL